MKTFTHVILGSDMVLHALMSAEGPGMIYCIEQEMSSNVKNAPKGIGLA